MRVNELLRAIAAFMAFSLGIALFLVSLIVVIAAIGHAPLFSLVGVGGMVAAGFIMQMSSMIVGPQRLALTVSDDSN